MAHNMKMSRALYEELRADVREVLSVTRPDGVKHEPSTGEMWQLFNRVMLERMNDDGHPTWKHNGGPTTRLLSFWSRNGETRAEQGNDHWLNRFYQEEDLNDSHIETALKRIAKEV